MEFQWLPVDVFSSTVITFTASFVVVIISYVVYRIGIAEKSFEEVIEEQKKRSMEEELKQKSEKTKKEKKFKKTWGKKNKEKSESESSPTILVTEAKDKEIDYEIIEPKETKSTKQRNKPKTASSNHQSLDMHVQEKNNKVDVSPVILKPVAEKATPEQKVSEASKQVKVSEAPKQVKVSEAPKQVKNSEIPKQVKDNETSKQVEVKEVVHPSPVMAVQTSSPAPISQKKKKKEQVEKGTIHS